jgi:hypothetical protein
MGHMSSSSRFMGQMKRIHQEKMNELKITYLEKIKKIRINRRKMYIKEIKEKINILETCGFNYIMICHIIMNINYYEQYIDNVKRMTYDTVPQKTLNDDNIAFVNDVVF